jgi:hypothetical protein
MSWIQNWAAALGITQTVNGTWIQAVAQHLGASQSNGTWIQGIAEKEGVTEPTIDWKVGIAKKKGLSMKNGSWQHSFSDITSGTSCQYPVQNLLQQVGTYNAYSSTYPFYALYKYSLSAQLHTAASVGGAKQITGIEIYARSFTTPFVMEKQEIWIGEVSNATFPTTTPKTDFSDLTFVKPLTRVANKTFTISSNYAWNRLTFDTPYCFGGTNNIIIVWKNNQGYFKSGYGQFQAGNVVSKGMTSYWDTTMPATGTRDNFQTLINLLY